LLETIEIEGLKNKLLQVLSIYDEDLEIEFEFYDIDRIIAKLKELIM
jgi:hypothetical protein